LAERWVALSTLELRGLVRSVIENVTIGDAEIALRLNRLVVLSSLMTDAPTTLRDCKLEVEPVILSIEASLRRAGKGTRLVIGDGAANAIDQGLASLIGQAVATRTMLLAGRDDSIEAMAHRLGVKRDYLTVLVRLSYLSPQIVRAVLAGPTAGRADVDAAREALQGPAPRLARAAPVPRLLLGLFDSEGRLNHVGFTSSIPRAEKGELTGTLEALRGGPGFTGASPGGPSRWSNDRSEAWEPLKPKLVVEVSYYHVTGGRFRHGTRLIRWRPDKAPRQCTMEQISS
jgi:hypothetical protein